MTTPTDHPRPRATRREWLGLAVLTLPMFMLSTDITVLLLAMPSITADLRPGGAQMLWILHIYGFLVAGLLITMGRLGDRVGSRRLLFIGTGAFGILSMTAAFSPTAEVLIASRALLGAAGASLMPSVYALLRPMFRDRREFTRAIAIIVSTFTAGMSLGPPLGGILLEYTWWGAVFLVNVPITALLLVLGPGLLPESRGAGTGRLDLASVVLSLLAVLGVIYGIQDLAENGLGWPQAAVTGVGAVLAVLFVRRQLRIPDPLLDLRLFANRSFSVLLVAVLVVGSGVMGAELFLAQYLQSVLGLSPLQAGVLMIVPALVGLVGTLGAPALARRMSPAAAISSGLALSFAGYLLVVVVGNGVGLLVAFAGILLAALGQGPTWTLGGDLIIATSPPERTGSASAMQEVSGEMGGALGMALVGSVGMVVYRSAMAGSMPEGIPAHTAEAASHSVGGAVAIAEELPGGTREALLRAAHDSFTAATQVGFLAAALASAAAAVLVGVLLRHVRSDAEHEPPPAENAPSASEDSDGSRELVCL